MSRIEVRGDAGANEKLLQRYLSRLDDQPVFNIVDAERYLLLARDIPGMDARASMASSTAAAGIVLVTATSSTVLGFRPVASAASTISSFT
jgi:hypothetical protein